MTEPLLRLDKVSKFFERAHAGSSEKTRLEVLKSIDLEIFEGDAICILGASGAGKSTLLHILGTLDRPSLGHVFFKNQDLNKKSDDDLALFRNEQLGFVFQFHHLLTEFTAIENIMMPARIAGVPENEANLRAMELLEMLGLEARRDHFPTEMSGGEQQRVAVARALIQRPKILLADEPTGNLDTANSRQIQELFFTFKVKFGLTLVVVTHDSNFSTRFPRRLVIKDGHWN